MKTLKFYFCECEHDGDLSNYASMIQKHGGVVKSQRCDYDSETGTIVASISDAGLASLQADEGYGFCEGAVEQK